LIVHGSDLACSVPGWSKEGLHFSARNVGEMAASFWYPSVEDVLTIHDDIVSEYSETHPGVQNRGDIGFALEYIEDGSFGTAPETIHEKAFHLL